MPVGASCFAQNQVLKFSHTKLRKFSQICTQKLEWGAVRHAESSRRVGRLLQAESAAWDKLGASVRRVRSAMPQDKENVP